MERYAKYKDSGVAWIGNIPEYWNLKKLKFTASINDESLPETTNEFYELEYVEISNVKSGIGILETEKYFFKDAPSRARRIVRDGDVIVSTVRTYLKSIAKINNPPNNLIASTGFAVVRPRLIDSGFTGFLFYSEFLIGEIISLSTGVSYPAINASQIGCINIPIPPLEEQKSIAAYLDRKTAEIDELIAQKQRLIALYEEEKTAIINEAVTKGINPDVKLKPSGIDWLGDIPEHWSTTRLNRIIRVKDGTHDTPKYTYESFDTYPLITSKDFKNNQIDFSEAKHIEKVDHLKIIQRSNTQKNDLIMSMIGGNIGNLAFVDTDREFSIKNVALFKTCHDYWTAKYLFFILKSPLLKIQIDLNSRGGAQGFLSLDDLRGLIYFVLPLKEQRAIAKYIEKETARIDAKIAKTKRIIELQKEYRTALISEAVTGKIKVSN